MRRVQTSRRLIQKQQGRLVNQCTSDRQKLFITSRQASGPLSLAHLQIHVAEDFVRPIFYFAGGNLVSNGKETDVFADGEVRVKAKFLRHVSETRPNSKSIFPDIKTLDGANAGIALRGTRGKSTAKNPARPGVTGR